MMLLILKIAVVVIVAYAGAVLMLYLMQERLIFAPTRDVYRTPRELHCAFEEVELSVAGFLTHGWYLPLATARGAVLFCHGNAGNVADRLESINLLQSFGLSVLAYDYGGYGRSTGMPSESRCYADARAMWQYLVDVKGLAPAEIVIFGRSLGGAVAAQLATEVCPAAVVLESTFLSIAEVGHEKYPWAPVSLLLRHHFDTRSKISRIQAPLLIIHSPDDSLIPLRHGQELFRLASPPKAFLEIRGDHHDGFLRSENRYRQGWERFLAPLLPYPALE